MSHAYMSDLPAGARFIGPDGHTRYEVTVPASEHRYGWVEVRNLSMSDADAERLLATPGAVEAGCDPRDGVFAYSFAVEVEVLNPDGLLTTEELGDPAWFTAEPEVGE